MLDATDFSHKGLEDVYFTGSSGAIPASQWARCLRLLTMIDNATSARDPDVPGAGFSDQGGTYSLSVTGSRRITYQWISGDAKAIDYV